MNVSKSSDRPDAALLTIKGSRAAPTLQQAALQLDLAVDDLDAEFGVVPIDPEKQLYAVRTSAPNATSHSNAFSDPKIETFGPEGSAVEDF